MSDIREFECGNCGHYFDIDTEERWPHTMWIEQENPLHPGRFDPVEVNVCDECARERDRQEWERQAEEDLWHREYGREA